MSEEYCDWTVRPDGVNLCTIACPGDCVLSGWSDWSLCPKVIIYTYIFIVYVKNKLLKSMLLYLS